MSASLPSVVRVLAAFGLLTLAACAPVAAPPAPTAAPAKPTAQPTTGPAAKPTTAPAAAASPAAKPAASPVASPSPAAAAKPTSAPAAATPTFDEKAVADFYRGKTVKIIVGLSAGGGYDQYSRMIARYLPKYLPGSPTVIVENRPGASSLVAANAVYKSEAKDGTVIANFNENLVMQQAVGAEGIEFDARKYQWLGSVEIGLPACLIRTDRGISSMNDLIAGKPLVLGTQGPGSYGDSMPRALNEALGSKIKLVPGYGGTSQIRLAMEQGEIDGGCWTWSAMRPAVEEWLKGPDPFAMVLVVMGSKVPDDPYLKNTAAAEALAKTDEARQLLSAVNAAAEMTKPYAVAPEVPKDRVDALRAAMARTMLDPEFLAEAKKAQLTPSFTNGEGVARIASDLLALPPAVLEKVKQVTQ